MTSTRLMAARVAGLVVAVLTPPLFAGDMPIDPLGGKPAAAPYPPPPFSPQNEGCRPTRKALNWGSMKIQKLEQSSISQAGRGAQDV